MRLMHIFFLILFALGMSCGQVLFKLAARKCMTAHHMGGMSFFWALLKDGVFWGALFLYAILTIYWIWLLTFIPLSRAYASTALCIVFVTLFGIFYLNEPLTFRFGCGIFLICLGFFLLAPE